MSCPFTKENEKFTFYETDYGKYLFYERKIRKCYFCERNNGKSPIYEKHNGRCAFYEIDSIKLPFLEKRNGKPTRKPKSYIVLFNIDNKKTIAMSFYEKQNRNFYFSKRHNKKCHFYENHYIISF